MKVRWRWLGVIAGGAALCALGLHLAQREIDSRVASALRPWAAAMETDWGQIRVRELSLENFSSPTVAQGLDVTTSFIRRDCSGDFHWGLGARVELKEAQAPLRLGKRQVSLGLEHACVDVSIRDPLGTPAVHFEQGESITVRGPCGPTLDHAKIDWTPNQRLDGAVTLTDGAACLKTFSFLAPSYPDELIPKRVNLEFSSKAVDFSPARLKGHSPVSAVAELSRRLRGATASLGIQFTTHDNETVSACARMQSSRSKIEFEVGLGISESSLRTLTAPFISEENKGVLFDLRGKGARCDGSGSGLQFSSDLSEVRHRGVSLTQRPTTDPNRTGLQTERCAAGEESCSYEWAVLEFNEEGQVADQASLDAIAQRIKQEDDDVLLVNFVHGWRHSGSPDDGNLFQFRALLKQLAHLEDKREAPRDVVGIYMAWPGRLFDSPVANQVATFWNRLEVARRLGSAEGELGPTLDRFAGALHRTAPDSSSRMITLGHSMGADAVLSVLIDHEEQSLGDMLILLNPASSVTRFRKVAPGQRTRLAIYGSVGDQVNQQLYPLGEALTFSGSSRGELSAHTTTITNAPTLITHRLSARNGRTSLCAHETGRSLREPCTGLSLSVARLPRRTVTAVSTAILPTHAEFYSPPFAEHLLELIASE